MINWDKTFKLAKEDDSFADTQNLAKTSNKKVVWTCENENCQASDDKKERHFVFSYVRKKSLKAKAEGKPELCQLCSHAHKKGIYYKKKEDSAKDLPPQINDQKTFEKYGYYAKDLKPWSRQRVVLTCDCGRDCESTRSQLNTYKSIKETGEFTCKGCWTEARRKGIKASEETKEMMKLSQQNRRKSEKQKREDSRDKFLEVMKKQLEKQEENKEKTF